MISEVLSAAFLERCPVSVCGEIAANPRLTPLLIGLGCRSFSMSASMVPRVKQVVRHTDYNDCRLLARRILAETDAGEIGRLLDGFQSV